MSEDGAGAQTAGTAPDTAAQTQTQAPAGTGNPQAATAPRGDTRGAEQALAAAVSGDGDGQAEDPLAKALADAAKWKDMARANEKRAKENAAKAQQYDAYEESQKTEQQKLADQLAAAQREAQTAREERFRLMACAQYDLPPSLIDHLGGGSEDDISARAEAFAQAINERAAALAAQQVQAAQAEAAVQQQAAQAQRGNGGLFGRPVESLRPGALPASDNSKPNDPNAWIRHAIGR